MTYQGTAALNRSAGGIEDVRDEGAPHELRQWTIKNLDAAVVAKARAAARQKGMKISSWVAATLERAADVDIRGSEPPHSSLSADLNEIVSKIEAIRKEDRLLIERIERDISQLVRGQHGMLAEMLARGTQTKDADRS